VAASAELKRNSYSSTEADPAGSGAGEWEETEKLLRTYNQAHLLNECLSLSPVRLRIERQFPMAGVNDVCITLNPLRVLDHHLDEVRGGLCVGRGVDMNDGAD
jgi:hypothetical protein